MNLVTTPPANACVRSFLSQIPDFKEVIDGLKEVIKLIYGEEAPSWILPLIGYILLGAAVLVGLLGLLTILIKIKDLLTDKFWPLFYDKEKARRSDRRRKFADHIESELRRLNNLEAWSDYRFAELEAEVDAEGRRRLFGILPSLYRTTNTLRREKSLSKALALSEERLIVVEGDPGSGKSVALRHVATLLARRAMRSRSAKSLIPIYVNLKEIERTKIEKVDRNLIEAFVLRVLNRANDRDIEEFLDEEFNDGVQSGTWFFLFDSFDEIPEVLSSTEADKTISQYATAISDFLHGLNKCRGVVASRSFHGPKQFGWARFVILPLSSNRRFDLIQRAGLKPAVEIELLGQVETSGPEFTSMVTNPMFLGLLCEHMRSGYSFPENSHSVFETYINSRLTRDKDRLHRRFNLKPDELRATAEAVAFCMAADTGLGLSPARGDLKASVEKLQLKLDKRFDKILDAITFLKLARADTSTSTANSHQFTFAHRRFQEYFSTAVVLREPSKVTARQLLTDARWRETAIVLCQTQTTQTLSAFLQEADFVIADCADAIVNLNAHTGKIQTNEAGSVNGVIWRFQWPQHALHVLSLLQEGLARRPNMLSDQTKFNIARILTTATGKGITADKKWALDVSGLASTVVLTQLLREAFENRSRVLRDSAYKQVARLNEIPSDLGNSIRTTLCIMTLTRRLRKERTATRAHLARLTNASKYLAVLRLLIWVPTIDLGLHTLLAVVVLFNSFWVLSFPSFASQRIVAASLFLAIFAIPVSYIAFYWTVFVSGTHLDLLLGEPGYAKRTPFPEIFFLTFNTRFLVIVASVFISIGVQRFANAYLPLESPRINWIPIWLYIALWAPSALLLARRARFLSPVFWPGYPVLALATSFRAMAAGLIGTMKDWKGFLFGLAGSLALTSAIVAVVGLVVYVGSFIPYITLILGSGAGLTLLVFLIVWIYRRIKDELRWRRWNKGKATITAEEFIESVRAYKSEKCRLRFINTVRARGLMVVSRTAEEVIYSFARELETSSAKPTVKSFIEVALFRPHSGRHYLYGVAVLDEVLRLLEQMRATR